jgi:hypothetical protein
VGFFFLNNNLIIYVLASSVGQFLTFIKSSKKMN